MKYTRKQLIHAQLKYNQDCIENPENFEPVIDATYEAAETQIDYLLSKVES